MIAVHLDSVSVTYIAHPIFEDLSWEIHDDRYVGPMGANGSDKSTLLRLIAGKLESATGFVVHKSGLTRPGTELLARPHGLGRSPHRVDNPGRR